MPPCRKIARGEKKDPPPGLVESQGLITRDPVDLPCMNSQAFCINSLFVASSIV